MSEEKFRREFHLFFKIYFGLYGEDDKDMNLEKVNNVFGIMGI